MKSARRGSTLLEAVTSIAAGSTILLLSIGLIHQSMHWSKQLQSRNGMQRTMQQLARQWRNDSHEALGSETTSEEELVFLGADGSQIIYRTQGPEVTRTETQADTVPGSIARKERFVLADACSVHFEQIGAPKRATFEIRRVMEGRDEPRIELRVESLVGRWGHEGGGP
jgi:hypothetical protein